MGKVKLGMENAKRIFEQIQYIGPKDFEKALKDIQTRIKDAAKVKNLPNLLQGGKNLYDFTKDLQEVYGCYKKWLVAKDDPKGINKAADFMFDSVDFVTGKFLPGAAYFQAITKLGREALKLQNRALAELRWNNLLAGNEPIATNFDKRFPHCFSDYEDFVKGWFCSVWNTDYTWQGKNSNRAIINSEAMLLQEIHDHIKEIEKIMPRK